MRQLNSVHLRVDGTCTLNDMQSHIDKIASHHEDERAGQINALRVGELFDGVEIVSEKSVDVYRGIFTGRGIDADTSLMAGNSLKSDINPVIEAGGWGVHVPHGLEWELEAAEAPRQHSRPWGT